MNPTDDKDVKAEPKDTKKSKKGLMIKAAIGLVVLILLAAGIFLIVNNKSKKNPATEKTRYEKMVKDSTQAGSINDKYKQKYILETYLKDPPDNKEYLYGAEIRLTRVCISLNIYTCANDAATKALEANPNSSQDWGIYQNLGDINAKIGNKAKAVEFYNKAIESINKIPNFPLKDARINDLKSKIYYLGGQIKK